MKCMMSSDGAHIVRVSDDEASGLYHNENYSYVGAWEFKGVENKEYAYKCKTSICRHESFNYAYE